jgi:hypothetical protein
MFTLRVAARTLRYGWSPEIALDDSYGFSPRELSTILRVVENNRDRLMRAWDEHFPDSRSL